MHPALSPARRCAGPTRQLFPARSRFRLAQRQCLDLAQQLNVDPILRNHRIHTQGVIVRRLLEGDVTAMHDDPSPIIRSLQYFYHAQAVQSGQMILGDHHVEILNVAGKLVPRVQSVRQMLDHMAGAGKEPDQPIAANRISAAEYTQHLLGDQGNLAGTSDVVNRGYEFSTSFNVTSNLTALVNFSYTKTRRSAIVPEFDDWIGREDTFWHKTAGAGALVNGVSGLTVDGEATSIRNTMQDIRDFNNFGYGERPYKANASARYSFSRGIIKGSFAGGGIRWQSSPKLGRAVTGITPQGIRLFGETYTGPEDFKADAFLGYRRKLKVRESRTELTVQLNVTNLTNEDTVMPVRYNAFKSGYRTVMLVEPQKFRLTLGLDF